MVAGAAIVAFLGVIASFAASALGGTKTGTVLALTAAIGPLLLAAAITAPIVFPFSLYAFITPLDPILLFTSAATVGRVVGAVSAVALIFYAMRNKQFADPDKSIVMWFLYYLWLIASTFWAMDPSRTLLMLPTALSLFGLYLVVAFVRVDMRGLKIVAGMTLFGGIVAAAFLLHLHNSGAGIHEGRTYLRTDDLYWNPDFLAGALLVPIALSVTALLSGRNFWLRAGALAGLLIMLPAVVFTGARGPELSIAAMFIYFLVKEPKRMQLAILLGIMVLVTLAFSGSQISDRWSDAISSGGAGRTDIWHVGIVAFKHNWLFGAGFNNFPNAYDEAFLQVFQPFYAGWHRVSHNMLLGNGVELGIIGLGLLLAAWFTQFRVLRTIPKEDQRYPLRISLESAIIGLFISGLFADMMMTKTVWLAFMLVALARNAAPVRSAAPAIDATALRSELVSA